MTSLFRFALAAVLSAGLMGACSDDGGGDAEGAALEAPTDLKATTVDGMPHLTWSDVENEDFYVLERMDHSAGSKWTAVKDAAELVPNSTQFHDDSIEDGKSYMYRVVAVKGSTRAVSNEVTWP